MFFFMMSVHVAAMRSVPYILDGCGRRSDVYFGAAGAAVGGPHFGYREDGICAGTDTPYPLEDELCRQ
jgi:hypothetical protein